MTAYFKILAQFFRAWFMPLPAHDDIVEADRANELLKQDSDITGNTETEEVVDTADAPPEVPPDPVNRNIANIDISHLVNPPEGSELRASRGTALDDPSISE